MEALKAYSSELLSEMNETLFKIRLEWPEPKNWAKKSIPVVKGYLDRLKAYIIENPFKRRSEEIYFFKEVKPAFMGKYIFLVGAYNTQVNRPVPKETNSNVLDYLSDEISEYIEPFFTRNEWLYKYYKEQRDELDSKLFLRQVEDPFTFRELPFPLLEFSAYGEPGFSTGFDYLFAQFRGYEELRDYLDNEMEAEFTVGHEVPRDEMKFTGSPGDFVELVRLFKAKGMPVDPETGLPATEEQVAQLLRDFFKVDWGDVEDFHTLQLIHGGSDLPERMQEALDKLYKKWEEEEGDKEYGTDDDPDPEK